MESLQHALSTFNYTTAQFIAERLVAQENSVTHCYWLAKSLYLQGKTSLALNALDPTSSHTLTLYLYARCCLDLNKLQQGLDCLVGHVDAVDSLDASACWLLIGQLNRLPTLI